MSRQPHRPFPSDILKLKFFPGLVGGHCIGVDPYYLTYKAEEVGYHPEVILSGRRINDNMGKFVAENTVKKLIRVGKAVKGAKVCRQDVGEYSAATG